MWRLTLFLGALTLGGCGGRIAATDAAPPDAAVPIDAPDAADPIDAPDAAPALPPPGEELTSGGGHLSSATYSLDVQLGHGLDQRPSESANHHLEPSTVIKP